LISLETAWSSPEGSPSYTTPRVQNRRAALCKNSFHFGCGNGAKTWPIAVSFAVREPPAQIEAAFLADLKRRANTEQVPSSAKKKFHPYFERIGLFVVVAMPEARGVTNIRKTGRSNRCILRKSPR
jgi:hypothetical protein